nr:hypothetical protein CFP56_29801 [Quercus suber]
MSLNICTHLWFLTLHSLTHSQRLLKQLQAELSLKAFTGQLWYCWKHFLCYMSQDYLFNIQTLVRNRLSTKDQML